MTENNPIHISISIPGKATSTYPVWIGAGILQQTLLIIPEHCKQLVVVTDHIVKKHYGNDLFHLLKNKGYKPLLLSFRAGEKTKNITTKCRLEERMFRQRCGRDTFILALGGGVVGDLAGFIAATYMRGIAYAQIPTTLLAMIDSSIGGKTGIDTLYGKNLIGAFWQPKAVIADINCLHTLPRTQMINGLIEALKVFLIKDAVNVYYLQSHVDTILNGDSHSLHYLVAKAVQNKSEIIQKDECEINLRMTLNFGHTIGHALEHLSQYRLLHGYAVAYGILVEAKIAELLGLLSTKSYQLIRSIMETLGIYAHDLKKWDVNAIIQATKLDKKNTINQVNYVLLQDIGVVHQQNNRFAHPVPDRVVKNAFLGN